MSNSQQAGPTPFSTLWSANGAKGRYIRCKSLAVFMVQAPCLGTFLGNGVVAMMGDPDHPIAGGPHIGVCSDLSSKNIYRQLVLFSLCVC